MVSESHQTLLAEISTGFPNNLIYNIRSSSAKAFGQEGLDNDTSGYFVTHSHLSQRIEGQWDPGSYVVYHDNPHKFLTESKGLWHRSEQGTNVSIHVYDEYLDPFKYDKNYPNNQAAQAPIKPYSGSRPKWPDYKAYFSSDLLGNAVKGRKSRRYYKYAEYKLTSSSLFTIDGEY